MFINEIISNPILAKSGMLSIDLRGRLSKATKLVLQPDFAMAADEFSNDFTSIERALPLARLPFRECWFELAQADRHSFRTALPSESEIAVKRVGFYFNETDQAGSWSAMCFWSWASGAPAEFARLPGMSPTTIELDPAGTSFMEALSFDKAPWVPSHISVSEAINASTNLTLRQGNRNDWLTGEPAFLVAMLALLNSKNAATIAPVDLTRKNKRLRLVGKAPLFSYHLVSIPARYKQRHVCADAEPTGLQLRAHWCRGHFKVRRTGVFFWSAHQRGNAALGFAHHDYVLTQPRAVA